MSVPPPPGPQVPLTVKGYRGEVTFDGWTVTIRHSGLGRKSAAIPLDQLSGVELRPASAVSAGMLTLLTAGTVAPNRTVVANKNPLAIWFWPGQTRQFEHLRNVLMHAIQARRTTMMPGRYPPAAGPSLADELGRLADLMQRGIISQAEFEQAKARLLGGMP